MGTCHFKSLTSVLVACSIAATAVTPAFAEEVYVDDISVYDTADYIEEKVQEEPATYLEAEVVQEETTVFSEKEAAEEEAAEEEAIDEEVVFEDVAFVEEIDDLSIDGSIVEVAGDPDAAQVIEYKETIEPAGADDTFFESVDTVEFEDGLEIFDEAEFTTDTDLVEGYIDDIWGEIDNALPEEQPTEPDQHTEAEVPERTEWGELEGLVRDVVNHGFWVLSSMLPKVGGIDAGRMGIPIAQQIFDVFTCNSNGPSLSDLSRQLYALSDQITTSTQELKERTKQDGILLEFSSNLDNLASSVAQMIKSFDGNTLYECSDQEKLVNIARAIGELGIGTNSAFITQLDLVAKALVGTSSKAPKKDIFQVGYEYYDQDYMFSGEVLEAENSLVEEYMDTYIFCHSVAMECLDAYRQVLQFTEEDKAALSEGALAAYGDLIKTNKGLILSNMKGLSENIVGKTGINKYGQEEVIHTGVAKHYANYKNADRFVFINKGNAAVHLSEDIVAATSCFYDTDGMDELLQENPMTKEDTKALAEYVRDEWKGGSILDYLKERGFKLEVLDKESKADFINRFASLKEGQGYSKEEAEQSALERYDLVYGTSEVEEAMEKDTFLAYGSQEMDRSGWEYKDRGKIGGMNDPKTYYECFTGIDAKSPEVKNAKRGVLVKTYISDEEYRNRKYVPEGYTDVTALIFQSK